MEQVNAVLCVGSGHVAFPCIEYVSRDSSCAVYVISPEVQQLQHISSRLQRPNLTTQIFELESTQHCIQLLEKLVHKWKITCIVALAPEEMQWILAQMCIRMELPLVTASYTSKRIQDLHAAAINANIPILTECGLDPGMVGFNSSHVSFVRSNAFLYMCRIT